MASQYSILRNYGKYVSPYNMDVMMQGMGYMQQKIDTNRQAINEYADYIINSDIAKPQDREYLQNIKQAEKVPKIPVYRLFTPGCERS